MKLATVRTPDSTSAARVDGDTVTLIDDHIDLGSLLRTEGWHDLATASTGPQQPVSEVEFAPPVTDPGKILCVGLNYRGHIEEMGRELPEHPTLFAKFSETLTGPRDTVDLVPDAPDMDWEGELALVIGREVRKSSEADAADAVAGYTIANDISMRDWQYRSSQWLQGKFWERSTPVGPVLVTADEFDPSGARLTTTVNDEVMQDHALSDLLFTPAYLVSYISQAITLRPGDMILTGTPGGVGRAREPQVFLTGGDVVAVAIDGIGATRTAITPAG